MRQTWYLENVFYHAAPELYAKVAQTLDDPSAEALSESLISIGFWPGGDRDGNPFVDSQTTWNVAERLRLTLLRCYRREIRDLRRRITFKHVSARLDQLQDRIEYAMLHPDSAMLSVADLNNELDDIAHWVAKHSNGLFIEKIRGFQFKLRLFGLHFASLDIRQDSRVIQKALDEALAVAGVDVEAFRALPAAEQVNELLSDKWKGAVDRLEEERHHDIIASLRTMAKIQRHNGVRACHRYIISNCRGIIDVAAVAALARMAGLDEETALDIVPLFETIADLARSEDEVRDMYTHPAYRAHLSRRGDRQTVMLGFSDGTKDGGYLQANWSIYEAKRRLSKLSRDEDITVVFFDGRGGPPARGGGNTHRFYGARPGHRKHRNPDHHSRADHQPNFPIPRGFNLELLLTAGLIEPHSQDSQMHFSADQGLIQALGQHSFAHYTRLKEHPEFMNYLTQWGTLKLWRNQHRQSPNEPGQGRSADLWRPASHSICGVVDPAQETYRDSWLGNRFGVAGQRGAH